ncbi:MAG: hypothetical protein QOJ29_1189 [Thermoleophilaceae bacterium]|jgi:hypothetical protein|nr:hypothetical protein [Thermoleophilaceae bacterium]
MTRFRILSGQGKYLVISSVLLALLVAPFAVASDGDNVIAGGRTTFDSITRVLGNSSTYATQQSNLLDGDGGAARYGCRSSATNEYCLLSKNTGGGGSFRFTSANSLLGGVIDVDPPEGKTADDSKPFTTNATGVATGLNADEVDGMSADEIVKAAKTGPQALNVYARVGADGKTDKNRTDGVTDTNVVHTTAGVYCFTGLKAQPQSAIVNLDGVAGETSLDTTTASPGSACNNASGIQLIVRTYDSAGALTDKPFYVQAAAPAPAS